MNTNATKNVTTQSRPELSIVVPAYDAERFIESCLASITGQMGPCHELIVIDDGSRDRTGMLAESVRSLHSELRIRVIRQANQGIAGVRNRALAESAGTYLLFVDVDDLLLPGALAALDDVIARQAPDVIACDFIFWRPDNERKSRAVALGYPANALCTDRDAILCTYFADRHTYVWANVFRREIYTRQPQPLFPPGRVFEDLSILSRLLADCGTLYRLAQPVIKYRQHPSSLTKAVSPKWCADFAAALRQVKDSFSARAESDALRMHIDVAACHFYIGIVKCSYQLPWQAGQAARAEVRKLFLDSLFHSPLEVLSAMERGALLTHDHGHDVTAARQVRKALKGSVAFAIVKTASRRLKMWQRTAA